MNQTLKTSLVKFAKSDIRLAKKQGSVIIIDCKVFGVVSNVTIHKAENKMFNISWINRDSKAEHGIWSGLTESMVVDFMVDAYDVQEVA